MIKFENVNYIYSPKTPNEFHALKDINLEIKEGSFTCIVGKTGCGKSTLIQHLNGLLIPTSGTVYVDEFVLSSDKKKRSKKLADLKKKVGIVFQFSEYQLFEDTVESDVAFGPLNFGVKKEDAIKIAHECLEKVGIPSDYYKKSPFELSGGEKRRVSIAGILALNPKILVLDEPTAGLDPKGAENILNLFKKLNDDGITIVLVSHDMNIVFKYASDVIVLDDGKVVCEATPSDLFSFDVEKYSLRMPEIALATRKLIDNGHSLDLKKIKDIPSLIEELKKEHLWAAVL